MMYQKTNLNINLPQLSPNLRRNIFVALMLFFLLFLVYANSFDCSWHFDDYDNIVRNADIQIKSLSCNDIEKSLYGIVHSGRWSRPLSYLSFAINYYLGGLNVFRYHVVNFIIHFLSAFFLYLFIRSTLKLPILNGRYEQYAHPTALLSAVFWAINPVNVYAVTYIVQRMSSMAALFYIMAMYFYLKGRTSDYKKGAILFYVFSGISAVMAFATKENAVMLPASLAVYDLLLIQGITKSSLKKSMMVILAAGLFIILIGLAYYKSPSAILDYDNRVFTMQERLYTQPRVLLFYISLLLYPITSRLMLVHDFEISKSLFHPWTTSVAIVSIMVIIFYALWRSRKSPLISYCILFFFMNHCIEGSFISLELVYEHRNYLPSMLFFVPIAILIINLMNSFMSRKWLLGLLFIAVTCLITIEGITVYLQNNIMKDEITMWSDNAKKAPNVYHVRQNHAMALFSAGRLEEAFDEAMNAIASKMTGDVRQKHLSYLLIGDYYLIRYQDEQKALDHYRKALEINSSHALTYDRISRILIKRGSLAEAENLIRKAINLKPNSAEYHLTFSLLFLKKGDPDKAIKEARKGLLLDSHSVSPYYLMAEAFKIKKNKIAYEHFKQLASINAFRINCSEIKQSY
jgi:protein O-mannosyl-transferase